MEAVYGIPLLGVLFQFIGYVIEVTPGIAPIVLGLAAPIALGARWSTLQLCSWRKS